MRSVLFVVLPSGKVKTSTIQLPIERLLEFGATLKRQNPKCEVYIKDFKGTIHPIE